VAEGERLALRQDMTLSRAEFLRGLPGAAGTADFVTDAHGVRSRDPGPRWRIALESLPDLSLGMIRLPRQRVEVYFSGFDDDAARKWLARFELYYRRAGG